MAAVKPTTPQNLPRSFGLFGSADSSVCSLHNKCQNEIARETMHFRLSRNHSHSQSQSQSHSHTHIHTHSYIHTLTSLASLPLHLFRAQASISIHSPLNCRGGGVQGVEEWADSESILLTSEHWKPVEIVACFMLSFH